MVDGSKVAYTFSVVSTELCPSKVDMVLTSTVLLSARGGGQRCVLSNESAAEMASVSCPPVCGEKC